MPIETVLGTDNGASYGSQTERPDSGGPERRNGVAERSFGENGLGVSALDCILESTIAPSALDQWPADR